MSNDNITAAEVLRVKNISEAHKEFCELLPTLTDTQCVVLIEVLNTLTCNDGRYPVKIVYMDDAPDVLKVVTDGILFVNGSYKAAAKGRTANP